MEIDKEQVLKILQRLIIDWYPKAEPNKFDSDFKTEKNSLDFLNRASNAGDLKALDLLQEINTKNYMLRHHTESKGCHGSVNF